MSKFDPISDYLLKGCRMWITIFKRSSVQTTVKKKYILRSSLKFFSFIFCEFFPYILSLNILCAAGIICDIYAFSLSFLRFSKQTGACMDETWVFRTTLSNVQNDSFFCYLFNFFELIGVNSLTKQSSVIFSLHCDKNRTAKTPFVESTKASIQPTNPIFELFDTIKGTKLIRSQ